MKPRKHFRTSVSTIDLIIADFGFNRIVNKETYFKYCVNKRIEFLQQEYDNKLNKILSYIIKNCDYDNIPVKSLSVIILSLSKVTNALSKGLLSLISE